MKLLATLFTDQGNATAARAYEAPLDGGVTAVHMDGSAPHALDSAHGGDITFSLRHVKGMTALVRNSEYWCEPVFVQAEAEIPDETQLLVVKHEDGSFTVVLPVVSKQYRCVLYGDEGGIHAKLFTQKEGLCECRCLAFTYADGADPAALCALCFEAAIQVLGKHILKRSERPYPTIFEYLGWCSWDAMQIRVNEQGLLEKCRELEEKKIPVRWAILDDMWADVPNFHKKSYQTREEMFDLMHKSPLASFRADPARFPKGLAHTVAELKKKLSWVGVWFPTTGYWFGVEPEGELFEELQGHLWQAADGRYIIRPTYEDFSAFFERTQGYLKRCDVDFVKIDYQSIARRFYKGQGAIGEIAESLHRAMEESATKYFENRLLNCMGCASESIWNRPESPLSRCSNDFQPDDREWFTHHILQCAYTCLLQGPVIHSDWDMWWTNDGQALKNSVIRAISGGPIYVSDEIGKSERDILMPLLLSDGRILRCARPGTPTTDCFAADPRKSRRIFKIQNLAGASGVLAAFNLDEDERSAVGTLSPDDVPGLTGERFAVYEHLTKQAFVLKRGEKYELSLQNRDDFRLYTLTPIEKDFAVIGLCDKFISPLTVKSQNDREFTLHEGGKCLVFADGAFCELEVPN